MSATNERTTDGAGQPDMRPARVHSGRKPSVSFLMEQLVWLESCANRIQELDASIARWDAEQIAVRLRWGLEWPPAWRVMHPVAAAEAWHREQRTIR